jgi:ABC-2 type transport system ATP-binding protein
MASIKLEAVSLSYPIFHSVDLNLKNRLKDLYTGGYISKGVRRNSIEVRALENVNFEARDGARVGVVGHNGAGKTTFLKVLAGIYRPQKGSIYRYGYAAAIINPTNGLHQDMTGYQNIENVGLISGLNHHEIRARIEDIAEFTELGEFLELPVSTYSAGMQTRLAFAIATAVHPEILIADENLSTGDARFMKRSQERMENMMEKSNVLILASHSVDAVKRLCNRAILFEHGKIVMDGPVDDVVNHYMSEPDQEP